MYLLLTLLFSITLSFLKITGISKDDAKRAPMCTRERTICGCRSKKCDGGEYVTFLKTK